MIEICAIASGSNGNCYYIGDDEKAVLVDAGISSRQIMLRMNERGLKVEKIQALFLTHEHGDHSKGARVLSNKLKIPVYLTRGTSEGIIRSRPSRTVIFNAGECLKIDNFKIYSVLKKHDALEPCSFRIEIEGISIGVFTDIGEPCENIRRHLNKCHAVFLESNYDEEMLEKGPYPYFLKKRISSAFGHLSNRQSLELVDKHAGPSLKHIFLSHLSEENNTPQRAAEKFIHLSKTYHIHNTSRTEASEIIIINKLS